MSPKICTQWVEAVLPAAPIATTRASLDACRDTRNSYVSVWRTDIDAVAPLSQPVANPVGRSFSLFLWKLLAGFPGGNFIKVGGIFY